MEYGNVTPERHDFDEVELKHTPDNTLEFTQKILQKGPPLKKARGPGRTWIETNRQELVSNLWNGDYVHLDVYQAYIASDSKLHKARPPVLRHQEKVYGWKCKHSSKCTKETRLVHFFRCIIYQMSINIFSNVKEVMLVIRMDISVVVMILAQTVAIEDPRSYFVDDRNHFFLGRINCQIHNSVCWWRCKHSEGT
jgi:hypothetical protein